MAVIPRVVGLWAGAHGSRACGAEKVFGETIVPNGTEEGCRVQALVLGCRLLPGHNGSHAAYIDLDAKGGFSLLRIDSLWPNEEKS